LVKAKIVKEKPPTRAQATLKKDILGFADKIQNSNSVLVKCQDGYTRTCKVVGKIKKNHDVKKGDLVRVNPWNGLSKEEGEIIWRYKG
jgi:translation initiation factor 1A